VVHLHFRVGVLRLPKIGLGLRLLFFPRFSFFTFFPPKVERLDSFMMIPYIDDFFSLFIFFLIHYLEKRTQRASPLFFLEKHFSLFFLVVGS